MTNTESMLKDVLEILAPDKQTLLAVRTRRDEVLKIVQKYPGILRTYWAGSMAHKTANYNADADGGAVLDRRSFLELGPEGNGEGPRGIVKDVRAYVTERLKVNHPSVKFRGTKRGMKITYNEARDNGDDPTVDLIIALTRKGDGLWIPNLKNDQWNASHPERHTELMREEPVTLRRPRAQVVRLVKGWNTQYKSPCLSSFNITALALECIEDGMNLADGLASFYDHAARELQRVLTPDPASVSPSIKLLMDRETTLGRLRQARDGIRTAIDQDDVLQTVEDELYQVFYELIEPPSGSNSKPALANILKNGGSPIGVASGFATLRTSRPVKTTRAYGADAK